MRKRMHQTFWLVMILQLSDQDSVKNDSARTVEQLCTNQRTTKAIQSKLTTVGVAVVFEIVALLPVGDAVAVAHACLLCSEIIALLLFQCCSA